MKDKHGIEVGYTGKEPIATPPPGPSNDAPQSKTMDADTLLSGIEEMTSAAVRIRLAENDDELSIAGELYSVNRQVVHEQLHRLTGILGGMAAVVEADATAKVQIEERLKIPRGLGLPLVYRG